MRKPNCSERNAALGILRDADQGVFQLSPEERDCLARVALAALMDECLDDATFGAAEVALERAQSLGLPSGAPAPQPTPGRPAARLATAAGRRGRRWLAAVRATPAGWPAARRRRVALAAVGLVAIIGPVVAFSGGQQKIQQAEHQPAADPLAGCVAGAGARPLHAELVALQRPVADSASPCAKPGARTLTDASHHG